MFLKNMLGEIVNLKRYIIITVSVILLSYAIFVALDDPLVIMLGDEDGFFECLTSLFFAISSILFFVCFRKTKNFSVLALSFILFVGAGEEVSWGQRMFRYDTPENLKTSNVQGEFNIHNLKVFNPKDFDGTKKTGVERLLEIEFLFKVFCTVFFICIPFISYFVDLSIFKDKRLKIPVVPLSMGLFFFISWTFYYGLRHFVLPDDKSPEFLFALNEVFEFTTSYLFFMSSLYFYNRKEDVFLS